MTGFTSQGEWNGAPTDKMMPIVGPTAAQLTALPDGTEVINVVLNANPMAVILGQPAMMMDGFHMNDDIRRQLMEHPGDLGIATTFYVLPENLVPDEVPSNLTEKEN